MSVLLVAISGAGDHNVKFGAIECSRLRTAPPRAVPVRALLAGSRAVVMRPRLASVLFTGPSTDAVAGHGPIVAE
jgi:hypothetical protein